MANCSHHEQTISLSGILMTEVRCFKTRYFQRWMRKTELSDSILLKAVQEMAAGLATAPILATGCSQDQGATQTPTTKPSSSSLGTQYKRIYRPQVGSWRQAS